jgi:hypothetical protein
VAIPGYTFLYRDDPGRWRYPRRENGNRAEIRPAATEVAGLRGCQTLRTASSTWATAKATVQTRIATTKPFIKVNINILQEADGCLGPTLLQHARWWPTKGIAGKTIVCKVKNGELQTHFTSACTGGIAGAGRSGPVQDRARGAVSP